MSDSSSAWFKALREAGLSVYGKAFAEVFIIGGLSILPLAMAAYGTYLLQPIVPNQSEKPYSDFLAISILSGQLYFYAMTFLAAVVWHSGQDMKQPFPLRILFWSLAFVFGMLCAFFFGIAPALPSTGDLGLSTMSVVTYVVSALLYFLILAFKQIEPPNLERHKRESEASLTEEVKRRRGISE